METEIRPTPGAVEAVARLAGSPFGPVLLDLLREAIRLRQSGGGPPPMAHGPQDPQASLRSIADEPSSYELFAALRAIENAFREQPRLGEARKPKDEAVRIGQKPELSFPVADIQALESANDQHPPRLLQRVLGLFGPNAPLPLHLTEYAFERSRHFGDDSFVRFADVFHHRLVSLFYRAWANSQPAISLDRPESDHWGLYIGALCGLGQPTLRNRDSVTDFIKLAHAGIFGRHVKCAEGLQIVIANHFRVPVRLDQWVGHWLPIPESERSRVGRKTGFSILGEDAVIGEKVWDCQTKFRIVLGPLSFEDYQRFLPNGRSYQKLHDLVRLYIDMELDWDMQLVLKKEEVPLSWLGNSVFLGWTSWLGVRLEQTDADDLVIG